MKRIDKRSIIPIAPIDRLIRKAGATRVSEDAGSRLAEILEQFAIEISKQAIAFAHHAKRSTVTSEDFDVAMLVRG